MDRTRLCATNPRAYSRLGGLESDLGRPPEAARAYERQIALLHDSLRGDPQNAEYLRDLVWAHFRLAVNRRAVGDVSGSIDESRRAVESAQEVAARFPANQSDSQSLAHAGPRSAGHLALASRPA